MKQITADDRNFIITFDFEREIYLIVKAYRSDINSTTNIAGNSRNGILNG